MNSTHFDRSISNGPHLQLHQQSKSEQQKEKRKAKLGQEKKERLEATTDPVRLDVELPTTTIPSTRRPASQWNQAMYKIG